ncbi:MAG: hypothetical protein GX547_15290 [Phycisphaerae bacterium]|nr:hypothetical protein [Phycisphaerae bacterium]
MRGRLIQIGALAVAVALVYGATRFAPQIDAGRKELNVFGAEDVSKNAPPQYAFAIQAFGAFRSLIVNIAFIRAETLKEEGRYYDAMQLASWICQLQPRFPTVWAFHSWNMAWNISVSTFTPQERWKWVYNGAKLLRDQGIPLNPRAVTLYKELAWIFNNKMGETMDDFHWEYKREWAWRMHLLLGPRPLPETAGPSDEQQPALIDVTDDPLTEVARRIAEQNEAKRQERIAQEQVPYRTSKPIDELLERAEQDIAAVRVSQPAELARRAVYDAIKVIDEAPRSLEELYAEFPETREMVTRLREIGVVLSDDELSEEDYWYDGKLAANFFARYRQLVEKPNLLTTIMRDSPDAAQEDEGLRLLDEVLGVRAGNPAGQALVRCLQRKVLTQVYRMDPAHMAYVIENFGPVDWRSVDFQTLYWVSLGLIRGGESPTSFQTDRVNTARLLFFALRNLFNNNKIVFEPNPEEPFRSYMNTSIDVDFVPSMHRAYITYGPMLDPDPGNITGAGSIFRTGHINFLTEAVRALYFADRENEAEHYYAYLRTHYGYTEADGQLDERYTLPLRDFVLKSLYGSIETLRQTEIVIRSMLENAYNKLAEGDGVAYNKYVKKALEFHEVYQKEKADWRTGRVTLLPFSNYQVDTLRQWLSFPGFRPELTLRKVRFWWNAPLTLRQSIYDELIPALARECAYWDFDSAKAFPEPEGMEQYRKEHPRREGERHPGERAKERKGAETPAQSFIRD